MILGVPDWDLYFLEIARAVSLRGKCTRRQVGALLVNQQGRVVSTGYNGFPSGTKGDCLTGACPRGRMSYSEVPADSHYTDPSSPGYCPATHAEANALLYSGERTIGCTMYTTAKPCPDCQRLIASGGVIRVFWQESKGDVIGSMMPMSIFDRLCND